MPGIFRFWEAALWEFLYFRGAFANPQLELAL